MEGGRRRRRGVKEEAGSCSLSIRVSAAPPPDRSPELSNVPMNLTDFLKASSPV